MEINNERDYTIMIFSEEEIIALIKETYSEAYNDGYSNGYESGLLENNIRCEKEKKKILSDFIGRHQEEFLYRIDLGKAKH